MISTIGFGSLRAVEDNDSLGAQVAGGVGSVTFTVGGFLVGVLLGSLPRTSGGKMLTGLLGAPILTGLLSAFAVPTGPDPVSTQMWQGAVSGLGCGLFVGALASTKSR